MKLGLVIPSHRRPHMLQNVLQQLLSQSRIPDEMIVSAVNQEDVPDILKSIPGARVILGSIGSCVQKNRGITALIDIVDIIAFIDDDFIVGDDYFVNLERLFEQDESIVALSGEVVADGATSSGFTFEQGRQLVEQFSRQTPKTTFVRPIRGTYGCNMAFRASAIGGLRFDERLALYAWQEDLDFSGALRRSGRIVGTNLVWGVHLGTKSGKGSEVRLGYSQVINPIYIARKGNISSGYAFRLAARNVLANCVKSIWPEEYVDRRGRLWGNVIGIWHIMNGRITPEFILELT